MATGLLLLGIPVLIGTLVSRGPYMYTMSDPSGNKPWADSPIKLIATPQVETQKVRLSRLSLLFYLLLPPTSTAGFSWT